MGNKVNIILFSGLKDFLNQDRYFINYEEIFAPIL